MSDGRTAKLTRRTKETDIEVEVDLDRAGESEIDTGVPFLDHMLDSFAKHSRTSIRIRCKGDLHVDDHHSVEDCALALGEAFDRCLGERRGIQRFGHAYAPLDEALARVVVDISGRPFAMVDLPLRRERIGTLATENVPHFFQSFATVAGITLHVDLLRGINDHHKIEACFKAFALAVRSAIEVRGDDIASTKGVL